MSQESEFVGHEPCPSCGSKDNLARYTDGHGYCFGCRHTDLASMKATGTASGANATKLGMAWLLMTMPLHPFGLRRV